VLHSISILPKKILTKALHEGEVIAPPLTLSILIYTKETAQRMIGTHLWIVTCMSRSTEGMHWPHASCASHTSQFTPTFIELDWLHQLQTVPFARPLHALSSTCSTASEPILSFHDQSPHAFPSVSQRSAAFTPLN
jgi:hypothetical protein